MQRQLMFTGTVHSNCLIFALSVMLQEPLLCVFACFFGPAAIVLILLPVCSAYMHGDTVSMLQRTQYKNYRSEWIDVLGKEAPKFGMDRTVKIHAGDPAQAYDTTEELKLMFSFDHDRHLTSWITVMDGKGNYLNYVEIDFTYSGDYIRSIKWVADYHENTEMNTRPDFVFLRFHWHEFSDTDVASGVDFLLVVGTVVGWLCAILVVCNLDSVRRVTAKTA